MALRFSGRFMVTIATPSVTAYSISSATQSPLRTSPRDPAPTCPTDQPFCRGVRRPRSKESAAGTRPSLQAATALAQPADRREPTWPDVSVLREPARRVLDRQASRPRLVPDLRPGAVVAEDHLRGRHPRSLERDMRLAVQQPPLDECRRGAGRYH